MSQSADTIASLLRVLATYDAEVITVGTPGEAVYLLESMSAVASFRARLVLIDMVTPDARLIDILRRAPHTANATFVLLSSLSAATAADMKTVAGADDLLLMNRGILHAEAAIAGWLGLRDSRPL